MKDFSSSSLLWSSSSSSSSSSAVADAVSRCRMRRNIGSRGDEFPLVFFSSSMASGEATGETLVVLDDWS